MIQTTRYFIEVWNGGELIVTQFLLADGVTGAQQELEYVHGLPCRIVAEG
jgi:hypothetical protein